MDDDNDCNFLNMNRIKQKNSYSEIHVKDEIACHPTEVDDNQAIPDFLSLHQNEVAYQTKQCHSQDVRPGKSLLVTAEAAETTVSSSLSNVTATLHSKVRRIWVPCSLYFFKVSVCIKFPLCNILLLLICM